MARREFTTKIKLAAFERSGGDCEGEGCGLPLTVGKINYDHRIPDALGGEPTLDNCAVLCIGCHAEKTSKKDVPTIAKVKRVRAKHLGARTTKGRPMAGTKASGWKKPFNRPAERR